MSQPSFIALVGVPQTGKSEVFERLKERYKDDPQFYFVEEAGCISLVNQLDRISRGCDRNETPATTQLLLQWAKFSLLVENTIKPALQRGQRVVMNGFGGSAFAYAAECCSKDKLPHLLALHKSCIQTCVLAMGVPPPLYFWLRRSDERSFQEIIKAGRSDFTIDKVRELNKHFEFYGTLPGQTVREIWVNDHVGNCFQEVCRIIEGENAYMYAS